MDTNKMDVDINNREPDAPVQTGGPHPGPGPGPGHPPIQDPEREAEMRKKIATRVVKYMEPYKFKYILMVLAIIGGAVLGMLPAILTKRIVDEALVAKDTAMLIQLVLLSLGIVVVNQLVGLLSDYLNAWTSAQVVKDMKKDMYTHLVAMDHAFYTTHKQGEILTHMGSDIEGASKSISGMIQMLLSNVATLVTTAIAMLQLNWIVALIGIAIIPLMMIPSRIIGSLQKTLMIQKQKMSDQMNQMVSDSLSETGSYAIKQFNREEKVCEHFTSMNEEATRISLKEEVSHNTLFAIFGIIGQIAPLAIYLIGGLLLVNYTDMGLTVGTITAMVSLLARLIHPVSGMLMFTVSLKRSTAMFERIFDYLDKSITVQNTQEPQKPAIQEGTVRFDHVDFGYQNKQKVLEDFSLELRPGEVVALVGPAGSGKTSVTKLMPRLYDVWDGTLYIADVDVRKIDLAWLRHNIGVANQNGVAMNGTIRNNLLFSNGEAGEEDLDRVCKVTGLYDLIVDLPEGYDTIIDQNHLQLSEGQKEQLGIARVLLKNPAIVVLDEATEELSAAEESDVQDRIIDYMKDNILLIITSNENVAKKADRIYVLDGGKIVESGTYEELSSANGPFCNLFAE